MSATIPKSIYSFREATAQELPRLLSKLTPAEKSKVTKYVNRKIRSGIDKQVADAVKDKQAELDNAIGIYGGRITGKNDDIRRVLGCIHPDRPDRSPEQLKNATAAFQRLLKPTQA